MICDLVCVVVCWRGEPSKSELVDMLVIPEPFNFGCLPFRSLAVG
jgi:hypothetical protein